MATTEIDVYTDGGGDYLTLADAWTSERTTLSPIAVGDKVIFNIAGVLPDPGGNFSGYVVDDPNDAEAIVVRGKPGHPNGRYNGQLQYSANHAKIEADVSGSIVTLNQVNCCFEGLQIIDPHASVTSGYTFNIQNPGAGTITVRDCRFLQRNAAKRAHILAQPNAAGENVRIQNNIFNYNGLAAGRAIFYFINYTAMGSELTVTGNNFFGNSSGNASIRLQDSGTGYTLHLHNNAVWDNGVDAVISNSGTTNNSHNASDDVFGDNPQDLGDSPATWALAMSDPNNANPDLVNVWPISGSVLVGNGVTNASVRPEDIIGVVRGDPPDIGPAELAGPPPPTEGNPFIMVT